LVGSLICKVRFATPDVLIVRQNAWKFCDEGRGISSNTDEKRQD
jgi:hypothetical protein